MLQTGPLGQPTGAAGHLKHPRKVVGLTGIGHVHNPAGSITLRG